MNVCKMKDSLKSYNNKTTKKVQKHSFVFVFWHVTEYPKRLISIISAVLFSISSSSVLVMIAKCRPDKHFFRMGCFDWQSSDLSHN